jgi:hypothetical protein
MAHKNMKKIAKTLANWLLPSALNKFVRRYDYRGVLSYVRSKRLFAANRMFRDRHRGERCFILCNGPSVNLQNLKPLRNEIVFSVSSGYHHKDYQLIRPRYHCIPQISYGKITEADVVAWFREMDEKVGDAALFLSHTESEVVSRHQLFRDHKVNYICMARKFGTGETGIVDISRPVPNVSSVSIMCLMIAMYMGFKSIYLLGTEHNSFAIGEYKYFYEPTVLKGKDVFVSSAGKTNSIYEELRASLELWNQYRALKKIAISNGVSIYNATQGGLLDEFPRVTLADVLTSTPLKS